MFEFLRGLRVGGLGGNPEGPFVIKYFCPRSDRSSSVVLQDRGDIESYLLGGACSPARGKVLGRCQLFLDVPSRMESTSAIAVRESAMRQWVWSILECAPYSRRRGLICDGSGTRLTALQMVSS
jgi:hypothetical protein